MTNIILSSPLTMVSQYAAVERLNRAIEAIQTTIENEGGSLIVKMKASYVPHFFHDFE